MSIRRLTACVAAAVILTGSGSALATTVPVRDPGAVLTLSLQEEADSATTDTSLECEPAGGDHPQPRSACEQLAEFDGDFEAVDAQSGDACVLIYAPVTVTAEGHWRGDVVDYEETFPNKCVMMGQKGVIFDF